jgi:tetratricopeptide (TPR) repeat protein
MWKASRAQLAEAARVANGNAESGDAELSPLDSEWRTLAARLELDGERGAVGALETFLAAHPEHAIAHYRLGRILLREGDGSGLEHLDRAMELDPDSIPPATHAAIGYLRAQGRGADAEAYTRKAWEYSELLGKVDEERRFLRRKDRLVPAALPAQVITRLRERLAQEPWIATAYLVRKEVALLPEKPCYVLGLTMHRPWYQFIDAAKEAKAQRALLQDASLPEGVWVFAFEGDLRWARKRISRLDHALIWSRPKRGAAQSAKQAPSKAA